MRAELPTPPELVNCPELAALHLLETALATVDYVLLAAHPELEQADFVDIAPDLSTDAWLADAILAHISGLQAALGRYRAQVRRRSALRVVGNADF